MLFSINFLRRSLKDRKKAIERKKKEKYSHNYSRIGSLNAGMSFGFATGMMIISVVFLILELLLLFYSIGIVLRCTKRGPERIVHMVLAIIFTVPYALFSVLLNPCAKEYLHSF
jgi:hypothetical protein